MLLEANFQQHYQIASEMNSPERSDEEFAASLSQPKKGKSLEVILSFSFAATSKTFFGVKLSISRHHCLSTHHSTNTHNHRHNYSIIHHPLQAILFFCAIAPIFATLVKIFPWLMMCHRYDYHRTTADRVLSSETWRTHHTYVW